MAEPPILNREVPRLIFEGAIASANSFFLRPDSQTLAAEMQCLGGEFPMLVVESGQLTVEGECLVG